MSKIEEFQWPSPPPRKGQSSVLFDDGYEEGWAKCIDTVKTMLAAQPAPAEVSPPDGAMPEQRGIVLDIEDTVISGKDFTRIRDALVSWRNGSLNHVYAAATLRIMDTAACETGKRILAAQPAEGSAQVAKAEPVTDMTPEQAFEWAWKELKKDLGGERWNAGDSVQLWAFFKYGWDHRAQYERQRPEVAAPERSDTPAAFACAKRAADPSNEFAACRKHCGDCENCYCVGCKQCTPTAASQALDAAAPCKYQLYPAGTSPRTCERCGKGPCRPIDGDKQGAQGEKA